MKVDRKRLARPGGLSCGRVGKHCGWLLAALLLLAGCGGSSSSTTTVATVTITPTSATLSLHGQQTFTAAAADAQGNAITGQTFSWVSSSPTVATVDTNGVVTAQATGTTQITATDAGIRSAAAPVTVNPPVASVSISPTSATIAVNGTQQFTATAKDANGNVVTSSVVVSWSNSAANVASISTGGLVTGILPGTAIITASVGNVTSPAATVTVTP